MADNLEGRNQDFDDQPIYDDDTRAYDPEPPDQNYALDEIEAIDNVESGLSWLLVGLVALAAVIVGLLIYYFLFNGGGGGSMPRMRSMTRTPRTTGEVLVPFALTFKTLAWVKTPPRWLSGGSLTFCRSTPLTPGMP